MSIPKKHEYPRFYQPYIDILDKKSGLSDLLETSLEQFEQVLYDIDATKQEYIYAEGKWTIKELVQHMIDAERVFVYRALRFSRLDDTPLSGFDENLYVTNYESNNRDFTGLLDEFCLQRRSNILMFKEFSEKELARKGIVDGLTITVGAIGHICSGHVLHHLKIIEERYL
jgi:hypothetical protein